MPNPATNNVTVAFAPEVRIQKVTVTDIMGTVLFASSDFASNTAAISLADYSTGYYFISAETSKGNWNGKLIKE